MQRSIDADKTDGNGHVRDSHVRDYLANERTYLAWLRTGISTMGFGIVIARLRYLAATQGVENTGIMHAAGIGMVFAVAGLLMILFSAWRYTVIQKHIRENRYEPSHPSIYVISGIVILLGLLVVFYLWQGAAPGS